jgi:hypothetical protein
VRVGELLRSRVVDAEGRDLGRVHDVRLVQDGPVRGASAALRLDALVVGGPATAVRLGVVRKGLRGPWLLVAPLRRLERRSRVIAWSDVASIRDGTVVLRAGTRYGGGYQLEPVTP